MRTEKKNYVLLIIWVILLMLIGSGIGFLTKPSVDTWYLTLNRSSLTPPSYVFGTAWSILYAMIAISGWFIWESKSFSQLKLIKILYVLQLVLNWSWTPLFFSYHYTSLALFCIALILVLTIAIIIKAYKQLIQVSFLLLPYITWLLFAGYLNFYIWQYN